MLKQTQDGIWQSELLLSAGVVHGYSDRHLGDMREENHREQFLSSLHLSLANLVLGEQVHGTNVGQVTTHDRGKEIRKTDGLVHKKTSGPMSLAVRVADCVPILAVDPYASIIGVAHAGWKGTLGGIAGNLIDRMKQSGADTKRVVVSIGPHIGMCCYNVAPDRAGQFADMFDNDQRVISHFEGAPHVDLGYANVRQLRDAGIPADHIDAAITCTSCQVDTFYSYRKDTTETFGEILGVIGYEH